MRRPVLPVLLAAAAALALPVATGAQSPTEPPRASAAPAFSGLYRFTAVAAPTCPASTRVGPLSVAMTVTEAAVSAGSEVSGVPTSPSENPDRGRFVLLRQGDRLHGAFGASTLEIGLPALEGTYRVWLQLMNDGTAATSTGGRSRASGTAFGKFVLALANDPEGNPVAECEYGADYQWSLEPI